MKKAILIIMIIASMLLTACAYNDVPINEPDEPEPSRVSVDLEEPVLTEEPVVAETPSVQPEPEEPAQDSDAYYQSLSKAEQIKHNSVKKLLDQARSSEENYFYRLTAPGVLQTDVWVKGDIVKRQVYRPAELDKYKQYNMVYMNKKTLTAQGWCETTKAKCWGGKGPFKEEYNKWLTKTPKDWVLEFGDDFKWKLDNKIADVLYHIIDYEREGNTYRLYINDYRGWPGKIEVFKGKNIDSLTPASRASEVYLYDDMDIGGVSDDDVTPG